MHPISRPLRRKTGLAARNARLCTDDLRSQSHADPGQASLSWAFVFQEALLRVMPANLTPESHSQPHYSPHEGRFPTEVGGSRTQPRFSRSVRQAPYRPARCGPNPRAALPNPSAAESPTTTETRAKKAGSANRGPRPVGPFLFPVLPAVADTPEPVRHSQVVRPSLNRALSQSSA